MGTINITGTGGIIEGNLGAANVNVNLDPIYGNFNGSTSSVNAGSPTMFDDIFAGAGTIMAWIYPKSVGETAGRIFDKDKWALTMSDAANVLEFSVVHSTTTGVWKTGAVVPFNVWTHVTVVYDGSSTSNDPVIYINGVATTIASKTAPAGTRTSDASDDLIIGNRADGARTFDGYIMDAKIYKASGISSTQAPIAAAKINQDPDLISPNPPKGWYKFNASTTADSSGNSNTAAASNMGSVVYDEFHVDVYDNNTQTTGEFKINQGKVEGLALSSVDFDGTDDHVDTSNTFLDNTDFTIACWIRHDGTQESGLGSIVDTRQSGANGVALSNHKTDHIIRLRIGDGGVNDISTANDAVSDNTWHHIVAGRDADNNTFIYIDGVLQASGSSTRTLDSNTGLHIGGAPYSTSAEFGGKIRDVKLFDYGLSAEQAASFYSGTYPQTPSHHYKLDEGSGATASDTGTATASNGDLINGPTYSNGTLELNGKLTIGESNNTVVKATLSAPRGILHLKHDLQSFGTLIHNNGTFKLDNHSSMHVYNALGGANQRELTFYNVTMEGTGGDGYRISGPITIEKDWIINNTRTSVSNNAGGGHNSGVVVTIGTTTSAGSITVNSGKELETYAYANDHSVTYQGVSSLYPALFTNNGTFEETLGSLLETTPEVKFGNMKFAQDFITRPDDGDGSGGSKITLIGDMEFQAFELRLADDTLDFNGQRAEFSGLLSGSGTIACGTNALVVADSVSFSSSTTGNMNLIETGDGHTHLLTSGTITNWLLNGGTISNSSHSHIADNILVGAGKFDVGHNIGVGTPIVNITTATGAELDGNTFEIPLSGDFTTTGGLHGRSCLNLEKDNKEYVRIPVDGSTNTHLQSPHTSGAMTVEAWVKIESDAEMAVWHKGTDYVFSVNPSGGATKLAWADGSNYSFSNWEHTLQSGQLNVGKWHHLVCVRDVVGSNGRVSYYIDGKLVGQVTNTSSSATWTDSDTFDLYVGRYQDSDSGAGDNYFDGNIENLRIWNVARTDAQIRESMFTAEYADGTSGLVEQWLFNEGSSYVVAGTNPTSAASYANGAGEQYTSSEQANYTDIWATAGTFDYGTSSTLNMTGNGTMNIPAGFDVFNLKCGASSKTTTIALPSNGSDLDVYGTLTVDGGTLTDTNNADVIIRGTAPPVVNGSSTLENVWRIQNVNNMTMPATTFNHLLVTSSSTCTAGGNMTVNGGLTISSGSTFNANANTIAAQAVDSDGTLDIRNSEINFSVTSSGDSIDLDSGSTLLTGNTTLTGNGTANTLATIPSAGNFEVVGDVSNLHLRFSSDLTVVGSVTNCTFDSTRDNIRQWHHTLDTQQLLDADEAGDDDLRLTKPALDNALELQTR